jgi:hypothetical protein
MTRGRRPDWDRALAGLEGSSQAKARLRALLSTFSGQRTLAEAAIEMGLSERRLHRLRLEMLQAALAGLEPLPVGRPRRTAAADTQTALLKAQVQELRLDLHAARIREEIALITPQLLTRSKRARATATHRQAPAHPCGVPEGCKS